MMEVEQLGKHQDPGALIGPDGGPPPMHVHHHGASSLSLS